MIEFQNVSFNLNDNVILNDVSMKIEKGLNTVVLGPSGAGKSSILKIILGLWTPDKGRILYEGKDTGEMTKDEFLQLRKTIGMVFQGNALFDLKKNSIILLMKFYHSLICPAPKTYTPKT
jgi:phospholipid/cholesterol/gamma-HCH transport system ATP-binding protein